MIIGQSEIFVNELRAAFHKPLVREHLIQSVKGKRVWLIFVTPLKTISRS